jgi:accessory gene regulator protein AgrB
VIRLFRVFIPASVVALLISEIVLVLGCYVAALLLLGIDPYFYLFAENNYWKLLVVTGLIILLFYFQDLYENLRVVSRVLLVKQV